eukprot:124797_1
MFSFPTFLFNFVIINVIVLYILWVCLKWYDKIGMTQIYQTLLITFLVVIFTTGFSVARWVIKSYKRAPHYTTETILSEEKNSTDKLQTKLEYYQGPNPFEVADLSSYEKMKLYLFCMSGIAFLRLILVLLIAIQIYFIALIVTTIQSNGKLHQLANKFIRSRFCLGLALAFFGFYSIDVTNHNKLNINQFKKNNTKATFRVIAPNHNTLFDGLILLFITNGSIAVKKEVSRMPIIGTILNVLGTLWIDRHHKKGRQYAKQQILDHINDKNKPPLIIFPQGTTSNIHTITSFKAGPFLSKQPVLPVAMNWSSNRNCDVSYVDLSELVILLHVGCCQFINYCHLILLPEHVPNDREKNNVKLFASNNRKRIINALNKHNKNPHMHVIGTKHSYSDFVLLKTSYKSNPNFDTSHLLMDDVISTTRLRTKTITYLADRFAELDADKSGFIEYDEFCNAFKRDKVLHSKQMRYLFDVFNTSNSRQLKIGFNDFLVGVATCFMDDKISDAVKIVFGACIDEENQMNILNTNIINVYLRNIDKSKVKDNAYDEWLNKLNIAKSAMEN